MTRLVLVALGVWLACGSPALAQELENPAITEAVLREARGILSSDLFGHYDVTDLAVEKIAVAGDPTTLGRDYGLVRATLTFSTKRNTTRYDGLLPAMFEPGHPACQGWLYLHCGVPVGHVFQGRMQVLLAIGLDGVWRAVSPSWRSAQAYSLQGYLILDGRPLEGYVVFPRPPGR